MEEFEESGLLDEQDKVMYVTCTISLCMWLLSVEKKEKIQNSWSKEYESDFLKNY
jgi:hypothetical protein